MTSNSESNPTCLVTVLMPVYNAAPYLNQAIDSILSQSFTDFEFLIINDGSTDQSDEIIRSYSDHRIRYEKNSQNIKLIATLNKGLELANGVFIARMDADDIAEPTRLETQIRFLKDHPEIGICGSWFRSFGQSESKVSYPVSDFEIRYTALYQCPFCHPTVVLRKELVTENDLRYSHDYPHAEDYEFWLRASRVSRMANIPHYLLRYRQHDQSVSKTESDTQIRLSVDIRKQFFLEAGIEISDEDLELFRKLNYRYNSFGIDEVQKIGYLLIRLLETSTSTNYLDFEMLQKLLWDKWFNLCTNHSKFGFGVWGIYWIMKPLRNNNLFESRKIKLLLKTLLRK